MSLVNLPYPLDGSLGLSATSDKKVSEHIGILVKLTKKYSISGQMKDLSVEYIKQLESLEGKDIKIYVKLFIP